MNRAYQLRDLCRSGEDHGLAISTFILPLCSTPWKLAAGTGPTIKVQFINWMHVKFFCWACHCRVAPWKNPLLAETYLLFERGAAEEPAASSTRPWPSSVDGLLAFYCWKLLTAGRCLLLRRLCLRPCPMVYCVLNSVAFVACLHKLRVPRRPHSFTSLRLRLIVRVSIIYVRYVVVFIDEPCLGEAFFGFERVCF